MKKKRIFIAINLQDANKQRIEKEITRIKQLIRDKSIKWVNPKNIHLTLAFLDPFDFAQGKKLKNEIKKNISDLQPFELQIEGLGVFPNIKKPRIIWIGINDHQELDKLEQKIKKSLDNLHLKYDSKPFHAHLTIGRIRGQTKFNLKEIKENIKVVDCGKLQIKSVEIMSSKLAPDRAEYNLEYQIKL